MECPKCSAACADGATECWRCGVVFAKVARRAALPSEPVPPRAPVPEPAAPAASDPAGRTAAYARGALIAGLAIWTWQFARVPMGVAVADSVLHLPNLIFHEAGHVILGIFGRFVGVLGGSLFQVALPLALAGAFLRQRDRFGAAVCTWWAGQNLLDVAPYIADARALQLVLLGGQTGAEVEGHDWEYLLTQMGWLHLDRTLGLAAHRIGLLIMIGALIWGAMSAARGRSGRAAESVE
jgi:hypothetical protein